MTEPPPPGRDIPPPTATAHAQAPTPGILMRSHYWAVWSEVAIDHEHEAVAARAEWMRTHEAGGNVDLGPEWHASIIAIAASAFAIDAWYGELKPLIPAGQQPPPTPAPCARQRRGPPRNAIILEALKRGFQLGSRTQSWQGELEWLFKEQRDGLVHPLTEDEEPATLIEGMQGSRAHERHCALTATRAAGIVIDVLQTCAATGRTPDLAALMAGYQPLIDTLTSRRAS